MFEVNHICSFGKNCHTAQLLKRNNFKFESYPFDWIFSEIHIILDCIKNDFEKFLDKQYYTLPYESDTQKHEYYYPGDYTMFNHRNPLRDKDYAYYERCVERFRKLIKNNNNKLFIVFFDKHDPIYKEDIKTQIINFSNEIKDYINNFKILFIYNQKSHERYFEIYPLNNIVSFMELFTLSESNGLHFLDKKDDDFLELIIKNEYIMNFMDL